MAVTGINGAGNAQLPWWQKGSTQAKPSYLHKTTFQVTPAMVQATNYYANQEQLIKERNKFYAANKDMTQAPKATFLEIGSLYGRGYSGVFGRSQSKQTVGLLGENWQQAYALDALRKGHDMLSFSILDTNSGTTKDELAGYKQVAAADQSKKTWTNLFTLYGAYQKLGGDFGYAKRYGNGLPPSATSKYGILTHINDKAIRSDDVQATYQHNLSQQTLAAQKTVNDMIAKEPKLAGLQAYADALGVVGKNGAIKDNQKIGKPNQAKISAMENALLGLGASYDKAVQQAIGTQAPSYSTNAILVVRLLMRPLILLLMLVIVIFLSRLLLIGLIGVYLVIMM